jgi:phenylpyruvate tautomerase PptA (4-oxalocrotonate tautomerase family)
MPFIDSKVTVKMSDEKKEQVKNKLGQAVSIMGKPESFLMVGFEDEYDLYFAGQKLDKGAFVSVQVFGGVNPAQSEKMSGEISKILAEELSIPSDKVYIAYQGVENWGWSGRNL